MVDEDAALMLAFQGGDRRAFETLFASYTPRLLTYLTRLVRNRARAEELVQDVFIRVHQAAGRYEPRARFSTWIYGIAHRIGLNELARAHHSRERALQDYEAEMFSDEAPTATEEIDAARARARIETLLTDLPERQRAALLLRSDEELGYAEIAEILGTTVPSVKSLIHRARETLLEKLGRRNS